MIEDNNPPNNPPNEPPESIIPLPHENDIFLEDEMKNSYLDYAMSVIVGRALPDVQDGLKPVHRRVLFAMHELQNDFNKPYKKSARIVGDVIAKYHPHGDQAIYDSLVRMARDFSLRYPLVDGQGNFGSIDGDPPAAMRYTEVRMAKIGQQMLQDIEMATVDFVPNYDGNESEPTLLPCRLPNLLVNGATGIAVGLATNIPPHNLNEVINATQAMLKDPLISIEEIIKFIPAPDFPTAGLIQGVSDIHEGYRTGRGRVVMRARTHIEDLDKAGNRQAIIVDELPYNVNKTNLLERMAELVKEDRLSGISHIQDESNRHGIRVVIELKRGENTQVIQNNLFKLTQLQESFGINIVALVDNKPRQLTLRDLIENFLNHRRQIIYRRTQFQLKKAEQRGHVLEGLAVALTNLDQIIETIKKSPTPADAKTALMARAWGASLVIEFLTRAQTSVTPPPGSEDRGLTDGGYLLTQEQTDAILELRLQRLTGMEQEKLKKDYGEILNTITEMRAILASQELLSKIIAEELEELRKDFGDKRRSEIVADQGDINLEDLIAPEDMVVTLSATGYIKAQPLSDYRSQKRGGRGKIAAGLKQDDIVKSLFIAHSHDFILSFSNLGRVYWLRTYEVPQGNRQSRGKPLNNFFPLQAGEEITAILPVSEFADGYYVFFATAKGTVKKTQLSEFSRPRPSGIIALSLDADDIVIGVMLTDAQLDIMLFANNGKAIRFFEGDVRPTGRSAKGVIGMSLKKGQKVIQLVTCDPKSENELSVFIATENGYGKRTKLAEFSRIKRGGQGVIAINTSDRNGEVVGANLVEEKDELMLITTGGVLIRTKVKGISELGRNTQGVRLIDLAANEKLSSLDKIIERDEENGNGEKGEQQLPL